MRKKENMEKILKFLSKKNIGRSGNNKKCTNKEVLILEKLMKNVGAVVSREDLINYTWGFDGYENEKKLDVYVSNLRKKIDKTIIKTVKGGGYKIDP
ncbi:winged helix-turn-helix domain-containing protein [Candidatus Absconditicoccus praedator]|uniref:winged helix-turn-helix domain-containing protein n=1 Tax=Candidatus Absconditicoccus praedator TaxID=2735562 RepID=UPI001E2CC767|nr:winged helix-turn-helix domain-containing protein [Candidatus Absconditicoccus praedator]UFX83028.1 winged helix-turn-helix domain-containing protein [Candidatus Absconditicoccus praedator]